MAETCRILGHLVAPFTPTACGQPGGPAGRSAALRRARRRADRGWTRSLAWGGGPGWLADGRPRAALPAHGAAGGRGGRALSRRRGPARLPGIVDSHSHLQDPAFDDDRDAVIERARDAGIVRIVVPGWDRPRREAAVALAARHADLLVPAVGIHPHHAAEADEADWAALEALAADPTVRAIGEIGLDYHRLLAPAEAQREAFDAAARCSPRGSPSRSWSHDREAHAEVTTLLVAWVVARGARCGACCTASPATRPWPRSLPRSGYLGLVRAAGHLPLRHRAPCRRARAARGGHPGRDRCALARCRAAIGATSQPPCSAWRQRWRGCAGTSPERWPWPQPKPCGASSGRRPAERWHATGSTAARPVGAHTDDVREEHR